MRKLPILLALLALTSVSIAQEAQMLDSMKLELQAAKTSAERVNLLDIMSRTMMNINLEQAEEYGKKLIQEAEESRDRLLMFTAYISNGVRCSYYSGVGDYLKRSIEYYEKALTIAKENRMEQQVGEAYMKLSQIHLVIPDREKALKYCNQAFSIITNLKHDSLQAQAHNLYGDVYLSSNENILSLRHYFTAMRIAETTKLPTLLRSCYMNLSDFYARIADFDKSLDYAMKAHHQLDKIQDKRVAYMRVTDVNKIGNLYAAKKNHDLAISYFERSVSMADSLKYTSLKVPGYISLLNQYLRMEQPARALEYFNSPRGKELRDHLNGFGFTGVTDQAYAVIYTGLNNLDSAKYYFERAMPYFEKNVNNSFRLGFYSQLATYYKMAGETSKAIEYFLKEKELAETMGVLENAEMAVRNLDTLHRKKGDFMMASQFNAIHYQYKDSIETLNKEKELTQIEADEESYRQQRLQEEEAEKKRRKNNIQYMAITIGIAALFVFLVVLGMFRVSANTIRLVGFFAFLMCFEFIFLIFKKNINAITQGEPWKDLAFMIALAAVLLPLHHWLEHRVIKYLTSHNRLTGSGKTLLSKVFVSRKSNRDKTKV